MIPVDVDSIHELTALIWDSVLQLGLDPVAGEPGPPGDHDELVTGAQVRISGAFDGRVTLRCSPDLARRLAGVLFLVDNKEVDDGQVVDAIGELANMVGGNLKALLPGPSRLGLPEPIDEHSPSVVQEASFLCEGERLLISVEVDPLP